MLTVIRVIENEYSDFSAILGKTIEEVAECVPAIINDQILDSKTDYWAVCADPESLVLGQENRKDFLSIVNSWNREIRDAAVSAVNKWRAGGTAVGEHTFGVTDARRALEEADDIFIPTGTHCIIGPYDNLHTVLSEDELEDMNANPDHYAIIDISFKYND